MSIEIVYDRRFIRTTRGIIPLLLAGSSNCYDVKVDRCGRKYEVAERHWTYFFKKNTLEMTDDELLSYIRHTCSACPETEGFRYRGKMLLYKDVEKWYAAGIRSAYSIEAYLSANPMQTLRCYLAVYKILDGKEVREDIQMEYIRTTEQLEEWLDRYKAFQEENESKEGIALYPCIKFSNITDFVFFRYVEAEHEAAFAAIAPAVEPGGWIQVEYEYGNIRRYSFDGTRCISEPAEIVVPSDWRYVVSTRHIKPDMDVDIALHGAYIDHKDAVRAYQQLVDWAHLARPVSHRHELIELETVNGEARSWVQFKQDMLPKDGSFMVLLETTTGLVPGIPAGE